MLKNNKAFTLLEMLMVMFIVTLIMAISTFNVVISNQNITLTKDLNALGLTIQSMQMLSLANNKPSNIEFDESGFEAFLNNKSKYSYKYNGDYNLKTNFKGYNIQINEDGNVKRGGKVTYANNQIEKTLTLTIGSGNYEIK